ncbi:MAG: hypothetical protein IKF00_07310 [Solobacterium sp.]|nr:hypothetical protein [Solobacterium sp.]
MVNIFGAKHPDVDTVLQFLDSSTDYVTYEPFRTSLLMMRKKTEEYSFVTTPYGFIIGWRSPYSDDILSEQDKYKDLLRCIKNNEYEPVSEFQGMVKAVTVRCKLCGKQYRVVAKRLLEEGSDCPCHNTLTLEKIKAEFSHPSFEIIEWYQDPSKHLLRIHCKKCNQDMIVRYETWRENQFCRNCREGGKQRTVFTKELHLPNPAQRSKLRALLYQLGLEPESETTKQKFDIIVKYYNGEYDLDGYIAFDKEVFDLTGTEYDPMGIYINRTTPIPIKHNLCGKISTISPSRFARGDRCPCRSILRSEKFEKFVHDFSGGIYICKLEKDNYCMVENTTTHEKVKVKKRLIMQELLRPTPSEILPLEEKNKNRAVSPYIPGSHGRKQRKKKDDLPNNEG